jgi:WD40 repeat protein
VISVAESRVVRLLRGHTREVVELAAVPARPDLLLSLSRDGDLRLWDVPSEACLSSIQTDACCLVSVCRLRLLCGMPCSLSQGLGSQIGFPSNAWGSAAGGWARWKQPAGWHQQGPPF